MKIIYSLLLSLFFSLSVFAQEIVILSPAFASASDNNVSITYDASMGNAGLLGQSTIYAHTGVITDLSTSSSDWKYVLTNWTTNLPKALLTRVGSTNQYTLSIGNIRTFYGVPANEKILKLAFVFRNSDGSKTGKTQSGGDIFVDVNQGVFEVKLNSPTKASFYALTDSVFINATASAKCNLSLFANGNPIATASNDSQISYSNIFSSFGSGRINLVLEGDNNGNKTYDTSYIMQKQSAAILPSPAGIVDGINYISDTSVILQLYAPYKNFVYVLGDFNNWEFSPNYLMNKTPNGMRYWIQLNDLKKLEEYGFQYCIDAEQLKVADVYADKILDPYNDKWISATTYPNLKPYPVGKTTEVVSVLQTGQSEFVWKNSAFARPNKNQLVIYELLIRDFIGTHDYKTLTDTLSYFKRLGINCIELMPINEFEGNESWGYNPMFYFAPDKYYGSKDDLKTFVDACHEQGIAVVIDMVLNHSFGQSPMVRMYFDAVNNRPAANNPWFNQTDKHPFGVGYDFNHENQATQNFVDTVLNFWWKQYNVDGFRFDLSKGFTQKYTTDAGAWSAYDQSRVDIWNRIQTKIRSYDTSAYLILEHLGDNSEEKVLADMGFIMWGKMTEAYAEALMGYNNSKANLSWANYKSRSFAEPNLVSYAESHDEERVMFTNLSYGNSNANYSTKTLATALKRVAAYHALLLPLLGPKMLWQGGELGYEVSINTNGRTGNKPFKWEYLQDAARMQTYREVAALAKLKQHVSFTSSNFEFNVASTGKFLKVSHDSMNTIIAGNFDIVSGNVKPVFQHTGWWFNYLTGDSMEVTDINMNLLLNPGDYVVYTDKNLMSEPVRTTGISEQKMASTLNVFPNPSLGAFLVQTETEKILEIKLFDLSGKMVYQDLNLGKGNSAEVLTEGLSKGIYILQVKTARGGLNQKVCIE
jgi:1,4-alpha-glucan branching enzyme